MCLNIFKLLRVALLSEMGCGGGIPWLLGAAAKILLKGYFNKIFPFLPYCLSCLSGCLQEIPEGFPAFGGIVP